MAEACIISYKLQVVRPAVVAIIASTSQFKLYFPFFLLPPNSGTMMQLYIGISVLVGWDWSTKLNNDTRPLINSCIVVNKKS
jgi:hypothetical protein